MFGQFITLLTSRAWVSVRFSYLLIASHCCQVHHKLTVSTLTIPGISAALASHLKFAFLPSDLIMEVSTRPPPAFGQLMDTDMDIDMDIDLAGIGEPGQNVGCFWPRTVRVLC